MSIAIVKIFESAMNVPFDLSAMLDKINVHHIMGKLTDTERNMLVNMARSAADPAGVVCVWSPAEDPAYSKANTERRTVSCKRYR